MLLLAKKYYYFLSAGSLDSAYHAQNLWALSHGSFYTSILGANFITNHCHFLCFLLAPFYKAWPDPLLMEYFKIWGFFTGVFIFFLILKKILNPFIALGAVIGFILAPANIAMLFASFNYEPFAILFVFLIFKALDEKKYLIYIVSCFLLAMVKEQMPLVVMMFGVFSFFFQKENKMKWALVPLLMGLLVFILEVFVLTPYVRKDMPDVQGAHWWRYSHFGKTPQQISIFLLTHPIKIFEQLALQDNVRWFNDLFSVWGGLSFFSPHILFVALPLFLKTILSCDSQEHLVTHFYYAATFTPFLFLASWNTLNLVHNKWRIYVHSLVVVIILIHGCIYIPLWLRMSQVPITTEALIRERFILKIPSEASVLSSIATRCPLSNRKDLYLVNNYLRGYYSWSKLKFKLPTNTDYLLLDFEEKTFDTNRKRYIPKITALNFDNHWRLEESIEDMALYVKNPNQGKSNRLIEKSHKSFLEQNVRIEVFDNKITLEAISFPKLFTQKDRIFPITMYWECLKKSNIIYEVFINVTSNNRTYYKKRRPIGSVIYPTDFWKKGEHIKENYFYLFPRLQQGEYSITIQVYNPITKGWGHKVEEKFIVQ